MLFLTCQSNRAVKNENIQYWRLAQSDSGLREKSVAYSARALEILSFYLQNSVSRILLMEMIRNEEFSAEGVHRNAVCNTKTWKQTVSKNKSDI